MKKALIITTISGFLAKFEMNDVLILQEQGYEVHYASNFHNPIYEFDRQMLIDRGIRLHHIGIQKSPAKLWENWNAYRKLKRLIEQEQIELIHCHNPIGAVVARLAAVSSRQKPYVIYTAHGFHFFKGAPVINWVLFYPVERILARVTNMIVTINEEDYERAKKFHLRKNGTVERIPGVGVDLLRFQKRNMSRELRKKYGIPEAVFHIVTAAELNANKNQKVVIEAIARLPYQDIYYSICGKGPLDQELLNLIKERKLSNRIRLLGYCNEMEQVLETADCFAFPSYREGLGIAAVEALACSVPVVAARNRGTKEYLKDGVNGIFCDAREIQTFSDAIKKLYLDEEYRIQIASNCRETAIPFGAVQTVSRMKKIYQKADDEIEKKREERNTHLSDYGCL